MKKIIIALVTLVSLAAFGYWIYLLNVSGAQEFQQTYARFGMNVSEFAHFLISSLIYWPAVLAVVAVVSFSALFANGKLQYLSIFLPIFMSLVYLGGLYAPVLIHGAVI